MSLLTISVAKTAREWRDEVGDRAGHVCESLEHDPRCSGYFEVAHHIVYLAHLSDRARWIVENGIALSRVCHTLAHRRHNASLKENRARLAVDSVNLVEQYPVPHFKRSPK
jgi:hypothetical protein